MRTTKLENDWCLYVFVRTALDTMNSGKAQAHSGHAANAFVFKYFIDNPGDVPPTDDIRRSVEDWMRSTDQGFGTQINLKAESWLDLDAVEKFAIDNGYPFDRVVDPTYPFEVKPEIFELMKDEYKVGAIQKKGKIVCFRNEETAFYIFGRRSDRALSNALKGFKLHP